MPGVLGSSSGHVARNFLALGSGEASARVIAFLATIYVARVLGSQSFGIVAFSAAILLYLSRVVDGGLDLGLGVQLVASKRSRIERLGPTLIAARTLAALVLALTLLGVGLFVLPRPDGAVLAAFGLVLFPVALSTRWIHLGLERTRFVAIARVMGEVAMVALVVAFVQGPDDLLGVPLAQFAGDMLMAAVLAASLLKWGYRPRFVFDRRALRPVIGRARRLVLASLLALIVYNSDLVFLRLFRDAETVGFYVAGYALITFLGNLTGTYGMSLLPTLARLTNKSEEQLSLYRAAMAQVLAVALPITVGGYLLAPEIIRVVFGESYAPAALPLQILIWTVSIAVLREVARVGLLARGREDRILRMNFWATAVNLLSNLIVIPLFGIVGAAAATVGTEGCRLAMAQVFAAREGLTPSGILRYWRPVAATAVMAAVLLKLDALQVWLLVPIGAAVYLACLVLSGGVRVRWGRLPESKI
jgi:O-antigen/teichoic acid export membrane protein